MNHSKWLDIIIELLQKQNRLLARIASILEKEKDANGALDKDAWDGDVYTTRYNFCSHEWHADQDNYCNTCVKCGARQEIYTE